MTESRGELFDLGYRHYEGPREGRMRARKAMLTNGIRSVLGLGRGLLPKVFPAVLFIIAMALALVIVITSSLAPDQDILDAAGYNQVLSFFLLLFAAVLAPDLLCADRRDNVIHLYLVRPLSPADYIGARWLSLFALLVGIVYAGQVVRFAGITLGADLPLDYLRDNWLDVPRFLAGGLVLGVFATTATLAVSGFTTRRAYATAFMIGIIFVSVPVAEILTDCDQGAVIQGRYEGLDEQGNYIVTGNEAFFDEDGDLVSHGGPPPEIVFSDEAPRPGEERRIFFPGSGFEEQRLALVVNDSTDVEPGLAVGDRVVVEFTPRSDGSLLAEKITRSSTDHGQHLCEPLTGGAGKWIALVDLTRTPVVVSDMVFGKENESYGYRLIAGLPDVVPVAWYLLLIVGPGAALWWRYRRIGA